MTEDSTSVFAVVELGSQVGLIAAAVFVAVFGIVCVVAWLLLRTARPGPRGATNWEFNLTHQLPVSKPTFERLAHVAERAFERPEIAPETRAGMESLKDVRNTLASGYQVTLILIGLGGVAAAIALFKQADPANMLGLPAGIILLLSLGALLSGLIPSRTVKPIEPLDRSLFKNVRVEVVSNQPLTIALGESEMARALAMLRQGASPDAIARSVYPQYDALGDREKTAVQQLLSEALRRAE